MVISLPSELATGGANLECFGLPDEHALIQAMQAEDDPLLGPNKLFATGLVEEDEADNLVDTGKKVKFFAIDFSDHILPFCREYDNTADDVETFVPIDAANIYGIPNAFGLFEKVQD